MEYEQKMAREHQPVEDEEDDDETFVALQKLLSQLNVARHSSSASISESVVPTPVHLSASQVRSASVTGEGRSSSPTTRPSNEELLEHRRKEREYFRNLILSKEATRHDMSSSTLEPQEEEDEDDEECSRPPSVESAISSRFRTGTFSRFNVRVLSRDRWATEEMEHLPIACMPKNPIYSSPADNPKLGVHHTGESVELREHLEESLDEQYRRHELAPPTHLTPPRSTWYMQMRDMELHAP